MANGKFSNGKRSNLKPVALLLAIALLVGTAVGGTLAWLTDNSGPVKNTFTVGNVDIELDETTGEEYKMIPGFTIDKNPKVTVKVDSEKCYVFVDVDESANLDQYIIYAMEPGWIPLEKDAEGNDIKDQLIFYRVQEALTDATRPTLTFNAYAVQYNKSNTESFTPAEAWATAKPPVTP